MTALREASVQRVQAGTDCRTNSYNHEGRHRPGGFDGKTLTMKYKGVNEAGVKVDSTSVYDRQ